MNGFDYFKSVFDQHSNVFYEGDFTLNIDIFKMTDDSTGELSKILQGTSYLKYESYIDQAINNIIAVFKSYFGYVVDYSIITNSEENAWLLEIYLRDKPEEPENPNESEEEPIDPPEEGPKEPTDPEEGDNGEDLEDATDENSHI